MVPIPVKTNKIITQSKRGRGQVTTTAYPSRNFATNV